MHIGKVGQPLHKVPVASDMVGQIVHADPKASQQRGILIVLLQVPVHIGHLIEKEKFSVVFRNFRQSRIRPVQHRGFEPAEFFYAVFRLRHNHAPKR
ncbi:hypothetical protein SDC9_74637 [bioreactor metagenome]|uniref:Uncharacterized protein n=1 Tax=bioreactor metagenome TaxID=1076179 RepID=A0A644YJD2_9ZZZZ